ncbi:HNH endonuclease [Nocardia crassostreae]|uniref:HNH endonuclease n=1 Tax=Nocardia crassostreae TaxID=53428 RepID=UPI001C3FA68B|nr:HNH endonuclease signature motif containing protein [Nocardia crassostreae]
MDGKAQGVRQRRSCQGRTALVGGLREALRTLETALSAPGATGDPGVNWSTSQRREHLPPDWPRLRSTILRRDGYRCRIGGPCCLGTATDVDHIHRGNDHSLANLRAACRRCHARKSSAEGHIRRAELRARRYRPAERHPGSTH